MAQGDVNRAARCLLALLYQEREDGAPSVRAEAGALLFADALVSLRGLEAAQVHYQHGRVGGL